MAEAKYCPASSAVGSRVALCFLVPVISEYAEPGSSKAILTPMGSMVVNPKRLIRESAFFEELFSRKALGEGQSGDSFDINTDSKQNIEPIMRVVSWAENHLTYQIKQEMEFLDRDKLFALSSQAATYKFDRVLEEIDSELESRITPRLCHTLVSTPNKWLNSRIGVRHMVRQATDMFVKSFDVNRAFAQLEFEHVMALLKWDHIAVHPNCLFGFVIDWLKGSPKISAAETRKLIQALPFADMCPIFLSNVVSGDKTLSEYGTNDDDESAVLFRSCVDSALVDIACGRTSKTRRMHGNKNQIHPVEIESKFISCLFTYPFGHGNSGPHKISLTVCVDGYYLSVYLYKVEGDEVMARLCLDVLETRLGSEFKVSFSASMHEFNSGRNWHSDELQCHFSQDETICDLEKLMLLSDIQDRDSDVVHDNLVVTVRRSRQSVKI